MITPLIYKFPEKPSTNTGCWLNMTVMIPKRFPSINSQILMFPSPLQKLVSHHPTTFPFFPVTRRTNSISTIITKCMATEACSFLNPRHVVKNLLSKPQHEGVGAIVRRSIGRPELKNLDPFLLLDEFSVSAPAGFPDHPHRGFETVTYMLQGSFIHEDFAGHKGTIKAGDLQLMTAGRGIVHSEMPAADGVQHGLQLWINLSSRDKMIEPRYQELESKDVNRVEREGVDVRVIAGETFGVRSPVYTQTPSMYLDFTMQPGSKLHQAIPDQWNSFVYILEGEGVFGSPDASPVTSHRTLVLSSGDGVSVWNDSGEVLRFVLIGGKPINEPVVQHGPFVMNTVEEIEQTISDYRLCKNGFENAKHWRSQSLRR